jgi:UDP-glucose 4-epimerase
MLARIANSVYEVPSIGVRFFNLYGPRARISRSPYSGVIFNLCRPSARRGPGEIFGDGEQIRDFTFVGGDIAVLRHAMAKADTQGSVLNICSGAGTRSGSSRK